MKLADGSEIDHDGIAFDGDEASVAWWWVTDAAGNDVLDGPAHTATFSWKYHDHIPMTGGGTGAVYNVDFVRHTGQEPTDEIRALFAEWIDDAIPRHIERLRFR